MKLLVALPALVIGGAVVGTALSYGSGEEDPAAPSRLVTVMGVWEGDEPLCRAFAYGDLLPHLDTLSVRFRLTPADVERCRSDFAAYESRDGWPRQLPGRDLQYPGYGFEVESTDPLEIMVHRSSGDPGNWAETRYRVEPDGSIADVRTSSASAGQGLGPVLGGFLGAFAWVLLALSEGARALARRREG